MERRYGEAYWSLAHQCFATRIVNISGTAIWLVAVLVNGNSQSSELVILTSTAPITYHSVTVRIVVTSSGGTF